MYAIEFETKIVGGMIPIPEQYRELNDDESIRVIILKKDSNKKELELYKDCWKTTLKDSSTSYCI